LVFGIEWIDPSSPISHKLIISIYMRSVLIPPKLMESTYDAPPHEV
jgi:hypothetical protein